jgi:EAL domain-containing protein (putative c-di-GMP-specific phosphodiesterase class I)
LHLKVIAEGVETQEQLAVLRTPGGAMMQGYLYSRPLPHDAMAALLQTGIRPGLA